MHPVLHVADIDLSRMRTLANSNDRARIAQRLKAIQAGDLPLWGIMTASEMICHLRGAFRVAQGEIPVSPIHLPIPPSLLKAVALRVPIPWRKNFETVPELKRGAPAMQPGAFEADRAETLTELERFCRTSQLCDTHAYFGPMAWADWMRWGYLHTDHHLRQFGR